MKMKNTGKIIYIFPLYITEKQGTDMKSLIAEIIIYISQIINFRYE